MLKIFMLLMLVVSAQTAPRVATYKGYEFSFYTFKQNWKSTYDAAKQVCVDDGARLAEIKSANVQDFITTQLTELGLVESFNNWKQGYWIGGVCGGGGNPGGKNNWKWEDGTSIGGSNYENWFVGCGFFEPNGNGEAYRTHILPFEDGNYASQTCNALGKWSDDDKEKKKNFICMKVFFLEIELNGFWYKFYNPSDPNDRLSYDDAKAKCESENGHLAYIKDDETQQVITTQLAGLYLVEDEWMAWERGYWIGAKCGGKRYNWKWEDETSIGGSNYENWYVGGGCSANEPNNNKATSRGMVFSFDVYGICSSVLGKWGGVLNGNDAKNWICMEDINECASNPCKNGGSCVNEINQFTCDCVDGYTGVTCETDINECSLDPCENGGSCVDGINHFTCNCADGYTGVTCETNINECSSNPCINGGLCVDGINHFTCNCAGGYTGITCETDINECESDPCINGGSCINDINQFICKCTDGFSGVTCQTDIDECASNPCINGLCVDGINRFTCNCTDGYTGITCETDINECSSSPCINGLCVDGINEFTCNCADGYTGVICDTDINECASNPCKNGGSCVDEINKFTCNCADGYTGVTCETDACEPSPCENSGTCVRKPDGKYSCDCQPAYTGTLCENASFESSENVDYLLHVNYNSFSTFSKSSEDCKSNGQSDLVIIKDAETQQNIENKASELYGQGANEFWIGAQKDDLGWSWLDGSQLTFTNWGEAGNDGAGNCLKMVSQSGSSQLQWVPGQCEEQLGYICEKPANNIDPCTETECLNSGTCFSSGSHFNCQCVSGFKGVNCEIKISDPTIAIIASVVAVIVVIIIIVACVCMWKKRKSPKNVVRKKTKKQNKPSTNNQPPSEDGQIYENVGYENALFDYKISASSLLTKYLQLLSDDKSKFKQQYNEKLKEVLETTESQLSDSVAKMPKNKSKNRYANIYSYDHSRVKIQTDGNDSDYINAGYIDSYEGARTFIASQGPKPETVKDFWKMIWETNSKVIVMLTNLMEKNKAKCEQYWPEPGCTLRCGSFEIQLKEENEKDSYITRTLLVSQSNQSYEPRSISQLHFTTWPDHGVPSSTTGFLRFYHHVKEVMETVSGTPVTVHCSAGVGRTGTLIGFDILMAEMKKHKSVNVLETVVNMRKDRTLMVQTLEQYIFLHKLLVEVHLFGSTDFKATEINQKIKELKRKKNDMDGFQCEYKNLDLIEPIDDSNEIASKPCNAKFNRFPGILPYDRARLILPPIQQNQPPAYYNGSMITGCPGFNGNVIAAQAPLPQHIPEFWHAVWYYDVTTIVMVTNLQQPLKILHTHSAQYWPMYEGQTDRHGAISVELKHESESIKSVIQRTILMTQDMTEKQVTQLHFQDWHEKGPNPSADSILDLVRTLQETQTGNQGKVLVHCNDGAGRTGVLISVANLVERIKSENRIDVFRTVKDLRDMRPKMVTSEAQYRFIYEVCRKFVEGFATYDNFK